MLSYQRLHKPCSFDAIMVSLNRQFELLRHYKNVIATIDHYSTFENIFTATRCLAGNNCLLRNFTEYSNN